MATIVCRPTLSLKVNRAWLKAFSRTRPTNNPLSKKSTTLLGMPLPGACALTVAVKVTSRPARTDPAAEEVTRVVVDRDRFLARL